MDVLFLVMAMLCQLVNRSLIVGDKFLCGTGCAVASEPELYRASTPSRTEEVKAFTVYLLYIMFHQA